MACLEELQLALRLAGLGCGRDRGVVDAGGEDVTRHGVRAAGGKMAYSVTREAPAESAIDIDGGHRYVVGTHPSQGQPGAGVFARGTH